MLDLTSLQSELDKDDDVERGGGGKGHLVRDCKANFKRRCLPWRCSASGAERDSRAPRGWGAGGSLYRLSFIKKMHGKNVAFVVEECNTLLRQNNVRLLI